MKEVLELLVGKFEIIKDECKSVIKSVSSLVTWIKASDNDNIVMTLKQQLSDKELSDLNAMISNDDFKLFYASNVYDNGNAKLSNAGNPLSPTLTICDNNNDMVNDTLDAILNA